MNSRRHIVYCIAIFVFHCEFIFSNDSTKIVRPSIFDSISIFNTVQIEQDKRIERIIADKIAGITERESIHVQGYRVQVFSSNEQRTAKAEAFKIEKKMNEAFPEITTYVIYRPPFWKVRLGNFRTQEEAMLLREDILKMFPQMQGDIYPVRDQIQIASPL